MVFSYQAAMNQVLTLLSVLGGTAVYGLVYILNLSISICFWTEYLLPIYLCRNQRVFIIAVIRGVSKNICFITVYCWNVFIPLISCLQKISHAQLVCALCLALCTAKTIASSAGTNKLLPSLARFIAGRLC